MQGGEYIVDGDEALGKNIIPSIITVHDCFLVRVKDVEKIKEYYGRELSRIREENVVDMVKLKEREVEMELYPNELVGSCPPSAEYLKYKAEQQKENKSSSNLNSVVLGNLKNCLV